MAAQVLGGIGVAAGIAVGGLLAEELSGRTSLAGMAQTAGVLGGALLAVPLARIAHDRGRAPSLATGYALASAGAVVVILGALLGAFPVMLIGNVVFGAGTTAGLQARYAATDLVDPAIRGRALSTVVWAATIGSVLGPNLAQAGGAIGRLLGLPPLAGPFVFSAIVFVLAALLVHRRLPDGRVPVRSADGTRVGMRQAWSTVAGTPRALGAMVSMACAHSMMVGVMVMTPVHLGHGGIGLGIIGVVISLHIAGMYALSPVMGWLTDKVGGPTTIMIGSLILFASMITTAGAGESETTRVTVGLTLLGLGWSAVVVAGSTLLTTETGVRERTAVQGLGDLTMGLAGGTAGLVAGPLLSLGGYQLLSLAALTLLAPLMLVVIWAEVITLAFDRYLGQKRGDRRR